MSSSMRGCIDFGGLNLSRLPRTASFLSTFFEMSGAGSSSDAPAAAAAGAASAPAGHAENAENAVDPQEMEQVLGGYQWRFAWLGVIPSTSAAFAPAGGSGLLAHHGVVAWANPAGDSSIPAELPLGTLVQGEDTSLRIWGASHIVKDFTAVRHRRSVFRHPEHRSRRFVLQAMAATMRVWPGNAYTGLGILHF